MIGIYVRHDATSDRPFDMTMFRSMPTPSRFVLWLFLALPVAFGVDAFGYLLPAGALKFDLLIALQISCNLLLGWFFGLIRFRKRMETGISILVIICAVLMPAILLPVCDCLDIVLRDRCMRSLEPRGARYLLDDRSCHLHGPSGG
jgi:hypothetical protein